MLIRKLFRTMGLYRAQFLSMIIMIALGVGVFVGMNMEWYSIDKNTAYLFDATGFADYRIVSEKGFSSEDADKIAALDGVDAVSRYLSIQVDVKEKQDESVALTVTENADVSGFLLMEGNAYEKTVRTASGFPTNMPLQTIFPLVIPLPFCMQIRKYRGM